MSFIERLQYLRQLNGLTEDQFGELFELSGSKIRLFERGKIEISVELLEKFADFFKVSPKFLAGMQFPGLPPEEAVNSYRIVQELKLTRKDEDNHQDNLPVYGLNESIGKINETMPVTTNQTSPSSINEKEIKMAPVYSKIATTEPALDDKNIEFFWPITASIGDNRDDYYYLRINGKRMEPTLRDQDIALVKKQSNFTNGDIVIIMVNREEPMVSRVYLRNEQVFVTYDNDSSQPKSYSAIHCKIMGKIIWKTSAPTRK